MEKRRNNNTIRKCVHISTIDPEVVLYHEYHVQIHRQLSLCPSEQIDNTVPYSLLLTSINVY